MIIIIISLFQEDNKFGTNASLTYGPFNINIAQMNKYSCTQILISVHMDRFAYMQNLRICKLKFALGLNQVQILRICIWCHLALFSLRTESDNPDATCELSP